MTYCVYRICNIFILVFVEGNYDADNVFCSSYTVIIVAGASFVFLQFIILVVCVLCIYASRNKGENPAPSLYQRDGYGTGSYRSGPPSTFTVPSPSNNITTYTAYSSPSNMGNLSTSFKSQQLNDHLTHSIPELAIKSLRTPHRD